MPRDRCRQSPAQQGISRQTPGRRSRTQVVMISILENGTPQHMGWLEVHMRKYKHGDRCSFGVEQSNTSPGTEKLGVSRISFAGEWRETAVVPNNSITEASIRTRLEHWSSCVKILQRRPCTNSLLKRGFIIFSREPATLFAQVFRGSPALGS